MDAIQANRAMEIMTDEMAFKLARNALKCLKCIECDLKAECDIFSIDLCLIARGKLEQIEERLNNAVNRRDDDAEIETETEAETEDVYVQGSGEDSEAFLGERIAGRTGGPR